MQNSDGGFAAFDKDRQSNIFYNLMFKIAGITDSAEIFDPSCADLTAHVIEGLALNGASLEDMKQAIEFIKKS
jgi:squalene-hopene/tetraprenyl-beta-curcumene cyclase